MGWWDLWGVLMGMGSSVGGGRGLGWLVFDGIGRGGRSEILHVFLEVAIS